MLRFEFLLLFILEISCFSQKYSSISVKYMPFSTETRVDFLETDFLRLSSVKNVIQVKNEIIKNDSINNILVNKLKLLWKDSVIKNQLYYDLRMQCKLFLNNQEVDSFYLDTQKMLVYHGIVYSNNEGIVDLILNSLCRPTYTYILFREDKYWPKNLKCCFDSTEFKEIYGTDLYRNP